ncbi:hypothetical protein BJY01DRAFT_209739 [Aspergillus pseudoustus]|uniref:F-box domain-containing protein n=1 Tax=Aspergillus pseudoustus TaxID=1810923 RepID=A0ABR4KF65_9EURO
MATLLSLPREIIHRVLYFAAPASRKQFRLASGLSGEIGRKWVFESVQISPVKKSCEGFKRILDDPNLARSVTKVYIDTRDPDRESSVDGYGNQNEDAMPSDDGEEGGDEFPRPFWSLVGRLGELPRLQSVALRFDPECDGEEDDWNEVEQSIEFRHSVLCKVFAVLANLPRLPTELAIQDLQNINPTDPDVKRDIEKVLGGLKSLRLNIANEHSDGNGEHDIEKEALHSFFPTLGSTWLAPAAANLEHLTLYSNLFIGFFPICDITNIHFPRLKTLALGNYTFMHDSQLDWITSHGSTLQELYLDDCPILYEVKLSAADTARTLLDKDRYKPHPRIVGDDLYASYDKRWCSYFGAFAEKLPHLRHFRFGHSPAWWQDETTPFEAETGITIGFDKESYMTYCEGYGPSQYMRSMIWDVEDEEEKERNFFPDYDCRVQPSEGDIAALRALLRRTGQEVELDEDGKNCNPPSIYH